ncbi:hypothetical protein [Hyphococcus sp.]|uniref:hypothetical protein n=1 Tax=Hyphococcus sp. TaxID=2038636 RepID=UPI003CCBE841
MAEQKRAALLKPVPPSTDDKKPEPWQARLFWFGAIALIGLLTVAGAAYLLRGLLFIGG